MSHDKEAAELLDRDREFAVILAKIMQSAARHEALGWMELARCGRPRDIRRERRKVERELTDAVTAAYARVAGPTADLYRWQSALEYARRVTKPREV